MAAELASVKDSGQKWCDGFQVEVVNQQHGILRCCSPAASPRWSRRWPLLSLYPRVRRTWSGALADLRSRVRRKRCPGHRDRAWVLPQPVPMEPTRQDEVAVRPGRLRCPPPVRKSRSLNARPGSVIRPHWQYNDSPGVLVTIFPLLSWEETGFVKLRRRLATGLGWWIRGQAFSFIVPCL